MRVGELKPGMLVKPVQGMVWVLRPVRNEAPVLYVEPADRETLYARTKKPIIIGDDPVLYLYALPYSKRIQESVSQWGARVVMCRGRVMSIDSYAWRRIEAMSEVQDG